MELLNFEANNEVELTYVPKILSGIDLIDKSWGGMYQGGSYMCYGHASSGRGLLGMMFLQTGLMLGEKGLMLSTGRPHDWMIQAASINFDLRRARDSGQVRIVWIPSVQEGPLKGEENAAYAVENLVKIAQLQQVERILINDFSPFLKFNSFDKFQKSFSFMMSQLDKLGNTTLLLMLPDAVNTQSRQIIDFMKNHLTGSIHIAIEEEGGAVNRRRVTLMPGIGHVNHEVFDNWEIPDAPITDSSKIVDIPDKTLSEFRQQEREEEVTSNLLKARSLARIEEVSLISGDLDVPSVAVETIRRVEVEHETFYKKLRTLFEERESGYASPFLLVAFRVEPDKIELEADVIFESLLAVMRGMIEEEDHLLIDNERKRTITFLLDVGADAVNQVFELFQEELREHYPGLSDHLPHAVSAVVVADGYPFESPEEFLAYALEGE